MIGGFAISYSEGYPSDHRMIFVDFNREELFGNPSSILPAPFHHFHTKQPNPTMKYKVELNRLFKDRGVWTRIAGLDALPDDKTKAQATLDSLDDEITRCMLKAAQMCARDCNLWCPWMPELWVQGLVCSYWRLLGSCLATGRDYTAQLMSMKITLLKNETMGPDSCASSMEVENGKQQAKKG